MLSLAYANVKVFHFNSIYILFYWINTQPKLAVDERNDGMKQWSNEAMKKWSNEAMKQWSNAAMKQWSNEAMNTRSSKLAKYEYDKHLSWVYTLFLPAKLTCNSLKTS